MDDVHAHTSPKRLVGMPDYDVFLSHNSLEAGLVEELDRRLTSRGLKVWRDRKQIDVGQVCLERLAQGLEQSRTVAVLIGEHGFGPWQEAEARRALNQAVTKQQPVFRVYLPGAPDEVELPESLTFLDDFQDVDLRSGFSEDGIDRLATGIRGLCGDGMVSPAAASNPFAWRGGITDGSAFFGRTRELDRVRAFLTNRQNIQVVGPRRIGKTSLLRHIQREARGWFGASPLHDSQLHDSPSREVSGREVSTRRVELRSRSEDCRVAFMDSQDARCFTLAGWLKQVSREFQWPQPVTGLDGFADRVDEDIRSGRRLVLCLDEVPELIARRDQFPRDFLLTLRACGQMGLSILTASIKPLSSFTDPADQDVSPFYNTFPLLPLERFTDEEAKDFLTLRRPGINKFSKADRKAILKFAGNHPLALQIACQHVFESARYKEDVKAALVRAGEDLQTQLPGWGQ